MIIYFPPRVVIIPSFEQDGGALMADERERTEFKNLFRSCIVNCISELESRDPDQDYNYFHLDILHQITLRYEELFELDESLVQLISDARDLFHEDNGTQHDTFECIHWPSWTTKIRSN